MSESKGIRVTTIRGEDKYPNALRAVIDQGGLLVLGKGDDVLAAYGSGQWVRAARVGELAPPDPRPQPLYAQVQPAPYPYPVPPFPPVHPEW